MQKTTYLPSKIVIFLIVVPLIIISTKTTIFADRNSLLLRKADLLDPGSLAVKLQDTRAPFSEFLALQLSAKTHQLLAEYNGASVPSSALQNELLRDLNKLLQESSLYNEQHFVNVPLDERTQELFTQKPHTGDALIRLNRFLLADAYPYELTSPTEKQNTDDPKGIQTCRDNLRKIKHAHDSYHADTNNRLQWLSELTPQYLDEKALLCPADTTAGMPGVLTQGAADPTLPCSYLYEFRPSEKIDLEALLEMKGDMLPIIRCQHHLLNLSVSGKLYRNGPQRDIYNGNPSMKIIGTPAQKTLHVRSQEDLESLRELLGDDFFETQQGKEMLKNLKKQPPTSKQPESSNKNVKSKSITRSPTQKTLHVRSQEDLESLRELLGDDFFETQQGKEMLKHASKLPSTSKNTEMQKLIGDPIPDVAFSDLSGATVTLEPFRGKFVLLNLFSADSTSCGQDLQRLEKQLENVDTSQLQTIGISMGNTVETIAAFQEKYQISMPLWIDKKSGILQTLNNTARSQTKLITILLNPELVCEAVFIDMNLLLKKVAELTEAKE